MSIDAFTEAARAEAETVMSKARECIGITVREQERYIEGHVAGAAWARDHLAAQEPTEEEIEAAAVECIKFLFFTALERPWEDPAAVEQWKPMARAALRAARAARREETR